MDCNFATVAWKLVAGYSYFSRFPVIAGAVLILVLLGSGNVPTSILRPCGRNPWKSGSVINQSRADNDDGNLAGAKGSTSARVKGFDLLRSDALIL